MNETEEQQACASPTAFINGIAIHGVVCSGPCFGTISLPDFAPGSHFLVMVPRAKDFGKLIVQEDGQWAYVPGEAG